MSISTWQTDTISADATETLAEHMGRQLHGGEVIELVSDLGGGKTTFVRGLARGIGSNDHVASPSFKISNVYRGKALALHHFDFYRLHEPGIIANELSEVLSDYQSVVVIEWADIVQDILPADHITIAIVPNGETTRHLHVTYPESYNYVMQGIL